MYLHIVVDYLQSGGLLTERHVHFAPLITSVRALVLMFYIKSGNLSVSAQHQHQRWLIYSPVLIKLLRAAAADSENSDIFCEFLVAVRKTILRKREVIPRELRGQNQEVGGLLEFL